MTNQLRGSGTYPHCHCGPSSGLALDAVIPRPQLSVFWGKALGGYCMGGSAKVGRLMGGQCEIRLRMGSRCVVEDLPFWVGAIFSNSGRASLSKGTASLPGTCGPGDDNWAVETGFGSRVRTWGGISAGSILLGLSRNCGHSIPPESAPLPLELLPDALKTL